ncbi:hypothetical protein CD934_30455 [Streptomyces calvus]|uniref:Uncharacterized protein n=1 Tax=Streptomyces calvus TaxID=67282 RepID=A0A514K1B1_9ACTN|nr:hypothetical protein CD934_30455 [Streptomyces calvus]
MWWDTIVRGLGMRAPTMLAYGRAVRDRTGSKEPGVSVSRSRTSDGESTERARVPPGLRSSRLTVTLPEVGRRPSRAMACHPSVVRLRSMT